MYIRVNVYNKLKKLMHGLVSRNTCQIIQSTVTLLEIHIGGDSILTGRILKLPKRII